MVRARASIATLLVVVGLMSVGFAALRVSSRLWANCCFSVILLMLVISVAQLIFRRDRVRAFWVGFALFGWTYFLFAFSPPPFNACRDLLISAPILAILEDQLLEQTTSTRAAGPGRPGISSRVSSAGYTELSPWSYWTDTDRSNPFASDSFSRIGHSLFCLGFALGGGVFCLRLRNSRDESSPAP